MATRIGRRLHWQSPSKTTRPSLQKWEVVVGKTLQIWSRVNKEVWKCTSPANPRLFQKIKKPRLLTPVCGQTSAHGRNEEKCNIAARCSSRPGMDDVGGKGILFLSWPPFKDDLEQKSSLSRLLFCYFCCFFFVQKNKSDSKTFRGPGNFFKTGGVVL